MLPVYPYILRAKQKIFQAPLNDTSTLEYQLSEWETLKKNIRGRVNKVNTSNLPFIIYELCEDDIFRGRGLLILSIIKAQLLSPFYTPVHTALVSFFNVTMPVVGELISKHLILSFRRTYQQNDKTNCLTTTKFIAHFINQNILHDLVALEILNFLLANPTDHSVGLAIEFLKECGQKLSEANSYGLDAVFSTLNNLLHQSSLNQYTQYLIEDLFIIRKDQFKSHPAIQPCLNLVDHSDQYTHMITLDDPCEPEPILDFCFFDDHYDENERKYYVKISRTILNLGIKKERQGNIIDQIEKSLVTLRDTLHLTVKSGIGIDECAKKLFNMNLCPEQEMELCQVILDECVQERTYEQFYGLLGQHLCLLKKEYAECFEKLFQNQYKIINRHEYMELKKIAKFFAHLLVTDSISWNVLHCIGITEEDIKSASRVYIISLFLELTEHFGLNKLGDRLADSTLTEYFQGIFPRDNQKNSQFSIKFFTLIGLSKLTDQLQEYVKLSSTSSHIGTLTICENYSN